MVFAEDVHSAEAALLSNQYLAKKDIMKLQKLFFAPETVSSESSIQVRSRIFKILTPRKNIVHNKAHKVALPSYNTTITVFSSGFKPLFPSAVG